MIVLMKATKSSIWDAYREGSRFFMKEGDVYETLRALVERIKPLDLAERLDESVRAEYKRLWTAAQAAPRSTEAE